MPTRKIKKSYRQVTGVLSSPKNNRMIASESTLERDLYVLLDFDPLVKTFEEQPITISYSMSGGKKSRYTPDCLINFDQRPNFIWRHSPYRLFFPFDEDIEDAVDDENMALPNLKSKRRTALLPKAPGELPKGILAEVKYRQDLYDNWKELKPKFKAARSFARSQNWEFRILTEKEIRTPMLHNIKFIRQFRRYEFTPEQLMLVLGRLAEVEQCDATGLLNSMTENRTEQGHLLPIIWHLVARHEIEVDWSRPITMHTALGSIV